MLDHALLDSIRNRLKDQGFYQYRSLRNSISKSFQKEFQNAADPSNKRNLRLTKSWHDIHSFGKEREIISIDLGGTNLNMFKVLVQGEKKIEITGKHATPFYKDKVYTPEILFSDLREELDAFVPSNTERTALKSIVFIFSFPIEQLVREDGYVDAVCTFFGKTRKSDGIVGLQVGKAFQEYLRANGYPNVSVSVTNDTPIYSLAAKGYEITSGERFDASMNIIVGTGMNMSTAFDQPDSEGTIGLRVINTESGDFKSVPLSAYDEKLKPLDHNPERYLTEKMMSGAWLSKVFGFIIDDLIEQNIISQKDLCGIDHHNVHAKDLELLIADNKIDAKQKQVISFVWKEINKRGGAIGAILLASILSELVEIHQKPKLKVLIMETGSVLSKGFGFRESLIDSFNNELGRLELADKTDFTFLSHPDQSAMGAVIFDTFFTQ